MEPVKPEMKYGVASRVMTEEEFTNFMNSLEPNEVQFVWSDINRAIRDNIFATEEERRTWVGRQRKIDELLTQVELAMLDEEELEEDLEDTMEIPEEIFHSGR